jgi:hypothetical protein
MRRAAFRRPVAIRRIALSARSHILRAQFDQKDPEMLKSIVAAAVTFLTVGVGVAFAGEIAVTDAYARSANPRSGAAFMHIENAGAADRLVAVRSDVAKHVEIHHHIMEDGVAKMRAVEGGVEIPADGMVTMQRGGLHVMLMGVPTPLKDGDTFPLTLVFEQAGDVTVDVTVDNAREPGEPMPKMGN